MTIIQKRISDYLLSVRIGWSDVAVTLTVDRRICTPTDGVHLPFGEIVIYNMKIPMSTSWHSLNQPSPKMIKCNCNLFSHTKTPRTHREYNNC